MMERALFVLWWEGKSDWYIQKRVGKKKLETENMDRFLKFHFIIGEYLLYDIALASAV